MHSFISNLSDELLSSGTELKDINIVVPGRRAGLFLKKELAKKMKGPSWLPQIYTVEDLAVEMSRLEKIDSTALLFEFYGVYIKMVEKPDAFDVFARWGQMLISDFNEIDRYMLTAKDVFSTLQSVEKIEDWDLSMPLSDMMKDHKTFWCLGEKLYSALRERLLSIGKGYQGMIFRRAAENASLSKTSQASDSLWVFAGFNAMNTAEMTIVKYFLENKIARIYYQADDYYMNDKHSAGVFLRRFKEDAIMGKDFLWQWDDMSERKNLTLLGVPKQVGQAKCAAEVLKDYLQKDQSLESTAVVLADEKLLVPMLSAMPQSVSAVNVTMGYPMSSLPASGWGDAIISLHSTAERLGLKGFYYKDVSTLLQQTVMSSWLTVDGKNYAHQVVADIVKKNLVDFSLEKLYQTYKNAFNKPVTPNYPDEVKKRLSLIFGQRRNTPVSLCSYLIDVINEIRTNAKDVDELSMEYLFKVKSVFTTLNTYMEKYPFVENLSTFSGLYHQLFSGETIDFYGEPLEGLQLMGILETRLLNFKNVIITGVNEGVLPAGRTENSFMPHDVKRFYGLPTYSEKDAIYSYHFFRLIQGAENVVLIYNTDEGATGQVEPSRFILQLKHDFANKWNIQEKTVTVQPSTLPERVKEIPKTPFAIKKTEELLKKGLSPSALCSYMTNPMDFYYKKILGVADVEEVDETAAANTIGTIVHEVLQVLFTNDKGQKLTEQSIDNKFSQVGKTVDDAFKNNMAGQNYHSGANYLVYQAVKRIVNNYLKQVKREIKEEKEIVVKELEEKITCNIEVNGISVCLRGVVDRIDTVDGVYRVVDYKTGGVKDADLKMDDVDEMHASYTDEAAEEHIFQNSKALQVLMYAYMYSQNHTEIQDFTAGIMPLRNPSKGFLSVKVGGDECLKNDILTAVKEKITEIVSQMLDPNVPYTEHGTIYYDIVS
ncbi:MAG: PD-(D/E)XK nuclease family protein [Flavobacteriales bacterium]|nr:PD-(D/E)XK nuclease family protein [Flavobacteriales bacterium]